MEWGGSFSRCPRGQGVGGKQNVHACPLGVGEWFKKGKILSTWLLNAPQINCVFCIIREKINALVLKLQNSFSILTMDFVKNQAISN